MNDLIDEVRPQPYLYNLRHNNNYVLAQALKCLNACPRGITRHNSFFSAFDNLVLPVFFPYFVIRCTREINTKLSSLDESMSKDWSTSVNRHVNGPFTDVCVMVLRIR